jgi:hypothetical protein
MPPTKAPVPPSNELSALELERVLGKSEAVRLSGVSWDTIRRNHADKIIHISPRRVGVKTKHVIALSMPAA